MLHWLKKILAKPSKQETIPKAFTFIQAQNWILEQQAAKEKALRDTLLAHSSHMRNHAAELRQSVRALQDAKLPNPDIPDRARNLLHGNRSEYCRQVLQFLDWLPEPDAQELDNYFIKTEHLLAELGRKTARPFAVLQEFLAHESRAVHSRISNIAQEAAALKNILGGLKLAEVRKARAAIDTVLAREAQRKGIQAETAQAEKDLAETRKTLVGLHREKARLQGTPALLEANEKISLARLAVKNHEDAVREQFGQLDGAFKRFLRIATRHQKTVQAYLDNPVHAITQDLHLDIAEALRDLERVLEFNRLDLKDAVRKKTEAALAKTDKNTLGVLQRELGVSMRALRDAEHQLAQLDAAKQIERIHKLITEQDAREKHLVQHADKLHKTISRIAVEEPLKELEQELGAIAGSPVTLAR